MSLDKCDPRVLRLTFTECEFVDGKLVPRKDVTFFAHQGVDCEVIVEQTLHGRVYLERRNDQSGWQEVTPYRPYDMSTGDQLRNAEMRDLLGTIYALLKILNRVV